MDIRIRAFKAVDDMNSCQTYVKGHMEVLKVFGITMITTANIEWFINPNVVVIVAESLDGSKMYGGMRIHKMGGTQSLPIESAVGGLDPGIYPMLQADYENGVAEFCGMWNSRDYAGHGISYLLTTAGAAVSTMLDIAKIYVLCAEYTVHMVERVGFTVETNLGKEGTFYYPKLDLVATVLTKLRNDFSSADHSERDLINKLSQDPHLQTEIVPHLKDIPVNIHFDIDVPEIQHI